MWKKSTKSDFIPANKKYNQAVLSTSSKHLNDHEEKILFYMCDIMGTDHHLVCYLSHYISYSTEKDISACHERKLEPTRELLCSLFTQNGFEKKVWMNGNAQWVMTNTNLQTTDQLAPNVYNDFTLSPYAMWTATNVNLIEFPKRTTLYVITVNLNNSSATKQLFYTLNGRLVQTRDVSYINPTLSPGIFNF